MSSAMRAAREQMGLTQTALGAALGLDGNTVARIERGELQFRRIHALALEALHANAQVAAAIDVLPEESLVEWLDWDYKGDTRAFRDYLKHLLAGDMGLSPDGRMMYAA